MKRNPLIWSLLLVCGCLVTAWGQTAVVSGGVEKKPRIQDTTFHSQSLGRDVRYRVLLPNNYEDGGRFPVLYLLHGLYGDYLNWDTRTGLETYAWALPLLIVMPDAGDSWYTNSSSVPADKFEDYIVKDLIAEVDGKYHTIRERHERGIAGLSMGGYGAIKLALKYPDLFVFAGSLSGALNAPRNLDGLRPDFRTKLLEVFGDAGSQTRTQNDVFQILKASRTESYPYFYMACGEGDFFLPINRAFVEQLSSGKINYEYHETSGGHNWEYWDESVQSLLQAADKVMVRAHRIRK